MIMEFNKESNEFLELNGFLWRMIWRMIWRINWKSKRQ
jgi:hypothetical protein